MTEDAAMQHLRRVRRRKEQAAGQPKFRVVLTARDLKWWETTYELLLSPTVRESRFGVQANRDQPRLCLPSSIPAMDCQEDISELENHKWRKRCESCQAKFEDSTDRRAVRIPETEGETVGFETKVAPVLRLRNGYQRPPRSSVSVQEVLQADSVEGGRGA